MSNRVKTFYWPDNVLNGPPTRPAMHSFPPSTPEQDGGPGGCRHLGPQVDGKAGARLGTWAFTANNLGRGTSLHQQPCSSVRVQVSVFVNFSKVCMCVVDVCVGVLGLL